MSKIKLCGMRRPEDIEAVNQLRPDYIGFVFYPKSKRNVTPEKAAELKALLAEGIPAVGVFVDAELSLMADLVEQKIIDIVQLHGNETEETITMLREKMDAPIIQAFTIRSNDDLKRAAESTADYILLDNGKGTGETFDWSLLETEGKMRDFFLAGGLGPENLTEAVQRFHPYCVDLSSGIETDGVKDPAKMQVCIERIRNER